MGTIEFKNRLYNNNVISCAHNAHFAVIQQAQQLVPPCGPVVYPLGHKQDECFILDFLMVWNLYDVLVAEGSGR